MNAKILIVDDHPLMREGLASRLETQPGLEICGEADGVENALELLESRKPDLVIVDLALRDGHGLDLIDKIRSRQAGERAETKMLVLSAHDEALFAQRVLQAGAHGYLNKQEARENVLDAVSTVLRGERYLSDRMTRRFVDNAIDAGRKTTGVESLSNRELEVFELIGRGVSTSGIADQLNLSTHTIETHRENIRAKLHLRNGSELVRMAVQWVLESMAQPQSEKT